MKLIGVQTARRSNVVILCGGKGTRMREETEYRPKPLVEIGGKPILWHIMKIYSSYGFNDYAYCVDVNSGKLYKCSIDMTLLLIK